MNDKIILLYVRSASDDEGWTRVTWSTKDIDGSEIFISSSYCSTNREKFFDALDIEPDDVYSLRGEFLRGRCYKDSSGALKVDPDSLFYNDPPPSVSMESVPNLTNAIKPVAAAIAAPAPAPVIPPAVVPAVNAASEAAKRGRDTRALKEILKAITNHFADESLAERQTRLQNKDPVLFNKLIDIHLLLEDRLED